MGMIESTITLQNRMTPILNNIVNSLNLVIANAYDVETATGKMFDSSTLNLAKKGLSDAQTQVRILNSELNKQVEISKRAADPLKKLPPPIKEAINAQDRFNESIKDSDISASRLGGTIKRMVGMIVGAAGVKMFGGLSDEMVSAKARLNGLVESQEELRQAQEMIYRSAQKTGSEYIDQINIVAKLGGQAREAFNGLEEVIKFQESVNMIFTSAGTSTTEAKNASLQLTQALSSGVLRGDELNSIFEQAPDLIRYVADYMDVPIGQIRKMASEGEVTGEIVKNAIFAAYGDIEDRFNEMPKTWGRIWIEMKNQAISNVEPALVKLNEFANSESFALFSERAMDGLGVVANGLVWFTEHAIMVSNVIADNWDIVEPVLLGIAAAMGVWTLATTVQAAAQAGLNATLLANPIFLAASAIGVIVMYTYHWIKSVGGVKMAYLILQDKVLNVYGALQVGILRFKNHFENSNANMHRSTKELVNNILNSIGFLKVQGLGIVDDFVNGAIERVNSFIELINGVTGSTINVIEHVNFKANAAIEEEALRKQRQAELDDLTKIYNDTVAENAKEVEDLKNKNMSDHIARNRDMMDLREKELNEANKAREAGNAANAMPDFLSNVPDISALENAAKGTEKNTKSLKDGIEVKNEDVRHLRDLMERRAIQNFSFEKLEVIANNTFGDVHETADLDGWMEGLTDQLYESVESTMGGVPAYDH